VKICWWESWRIWWIR